MVLLALGILSVSLLFLAYRYSLYKLTFQPLRSSAQQEKKHKATSPGTSDTEQEKLPPTFQVTLPEIPEQKHSPTESLTAEMRNPFEDEDSQGKTRHAMQPSALMLTANGKNAPSVGSMPPPSRLNPQPAFARVPPIPSNMTTLRPPPSSASTLRAPPGRASQTNSLSAPSTSTLAPSSRPSRKVLLEPGHSPLDWAHLTTNPPSSTFLRGVDVPPNLIRIPPSLLKYHNGRKEKETGRTKDAWGVWQGKVYNLTPYMKFHPGGPEQLMRGAGNMKAQQLFNETHSWVSWDNMMGECLVGILVSENEVQQTDAMEEMD